jgi:adenine/guanine/hypoxanthine permease
VNVKTEIAAGTTTFFTMAYVVVVNPAILSSEGTGLAFGPVMTLLALERFAV